MLEFIVIPDTNIMEIVVDGKVTTEELKGAHAAFEKLAGEHEKVRMLKHVRALGGIEASGFWDNLKFGFEAMKSIDRVAVVADRKWIEIWTKLANPFTSAEAKYFGEGEIDAARAWLRSD